MIILNFKSERQLKILIKQMALKVKNKNAYGKMHDKGMQKRRLVI